MKDQHCGCGPVHQQRWHRLATPPVQSSSCRPRRNRHRSKAGEYPRLHQAPCARGGLRLGLLVAQKLGRRHRRGPFPPERQPRAQPQASARSQPDRLRVILPRHQQVVHRPIRVRLRVAVLESSHGAPLRYRRREESQDLPAAVLPADPQLVVRGRGSLPIEL